MYGGLPISAVAVLVYLLISQGLPCLLTGDEKKIYTQLCPFAIADFLKLNFRGMLCILRCECIFAHEVKLLSSSRIGSILTERG
jgi:hypothetical protein